MSLPGSTIINRNVFSSGINSLNKSWFFQTTLRIIIASSTILFFLLLWKWPKIPLLVPLWFSRPWGQEQLAPSLWLFFMPFLSVFFFIINTLISVFFLSSYKVFTQILLMSSAASALLIFYITVNIVNLVT